MQRTGVKSLVKWILGDKALGYIDFFRFPERGRAWGGPFNGQKVRRALFQDLIEGLRPAAIVETGTYFGTTTALLAECGVPVFTIESHARNYGFSRARLGRYRNVILRHGDSRRELRALFDGQLGALVDSTLFCYLDAHWNEELPLAEELMIIFSRYRAAVVMIDDFQVPGDSGYGYDDYGPGKVLNEEYIAPAVAAHGLVVFYPSTPSGEETGARRGCTVVCKDVVLAEKLAGNPFLGQVRTGC